MRILVPATARRALALLIAATLTGGACSAGGRSTGGSATPSARAAGGNDIAPADRDSLRDGGTLRWPLTQIPPNFNVNHLDGSLGDNVSVMGALMPSVFDFDAEAQPVLKTEYVTSAELTATEPNQVVTYRINRQAAWDDGTPITAADFEAQWRALNGQDQAYAVASTQGYDKIAGVAAGVDEREVVVTFAAPYADWRGLFSPLYPAATNRDPSVFNEGWKFTVPTSAGPFRFERLDQTAKHITIVRNEKWWGRPAKLDRIVYRSIDQDAQIDSLVNDEIDFISTGSDINKLRRAESTRGVALRRAAAPNFNHLTINGTSEALADVRVRRALARGIDRGTIARALLGPLGVEPVALGNHIFMTNQKGYRDNSGALSFDPEAARALLEEAGWALPTPDAAVRIKDGRPLAVRLVLPAQSTIGRQIAELIVGMLADIGMTVELHNVPGSDFFEDYVTPGNFDLVLFSWGGTVFPVSSAKSIYAKPKPRPDGGFDIQQNYARIGTDEIDALFDQATATFDPDEVIELGNRIDERIWDVVHSLPLYQLPGTIAVKETLANFGAFGFASIVYEDIGFGE